MDLRRLEAFTAVYELRSFSRAGEEIYLSQPTISAHIASLEEELGVSLFDRLGRSILPTQAGDILYKAAREVFDRLGRVSSEIQLLRDKVVGDLAVGGSPVPAAHVLPRVLSDFLESYPSVRATVHVADSADVVERVCTGDLLMGIVGRRPDSRPELTSTVFLTDEVVVAGHPALVSGGRPRDSANFRAWPWVMREQGSTSRTFVDKALARQGLSMADLRVNAFVDGSESALHCILAGMGVGPVSRLAAAQYLHSESLLEVPELSVAGERTYYMINRQGRDLFPAQRFFLEFARNYAQQF